MYTKPAKKPKHHQNSENTKMTHNIQQRLKKRRQKNQYQIVKELDQHLTLILDNPNTQHHYRHLGNLQQIKKHRPQRNLDNLNQKQVAEILQEIENSSYASKTSEYKQSTKNKYRKTLDYLLQMQGKEWDDLTPKGVDTYQTTTDQKPTDKDQLLNPKELNKYLSTLEGLSGKGNELRNTAFFYTLWNTGARVGGILKIKAEDVKIKDQVVEVSVPPHKDSPRREDLPLYFAAPTLKRYLKTVPSSQEHLFESRENNPLQYRAVRDKAVETWKQLENHGIVDVEWRGQPLHIFRKSFKTYAGIMELLGPDELDLWTGHAIGSTQIKKIYDRRDTEAAGTQMRSSLGLEKNRETDWKSLIAPQKCTECGQRCSSHREICFSCGGVLKPEELPGSLDEKKVDEVSVEKSVELALAMDENPGKSLNELKEDIF